LFKTIRQPLTCAAVVILAVSLTHAAQPPLTLETANHATGYMEWMLDVRFTAEQRQRYQRILAEMWRTEDQDARNALGTMAATYQRLAAMSDPERLRMRAATQQQFLRILESAGDDSSRWLLDLYRTAHPGPAGASGPPEPPPTEPAPGLVGRWTDGHISAIQYRNAYTGVSAPTNGRSFAYEFKADGTYSFTGLMQSVVYNCTTAMFSNESGAYALSGDSISLRPGKNPYRMTNNCAPSSNREGPGKLVNRTYRFRVLSEGGRRYLELRAEDGSVQKFGESR
jgi:hypothetical protein